MASKRLGFKKRTYSESVVERGEIALLRRHVFTVLSPPTQAPELCYTTAGPSRRAVLLCSARPTGEEDGFDWRSAQHLSR